MTRNTAEMNEDTESGFKMAAGLNANYEKSVNGSQELADDVER